MSGKIQLVYFDMRGRAELIRLILTLAGKDFEDTRFPREDWPKWKPETPFGQIPYMVYNGKKYGQSMAIATFCAREFSLYGKSNLDGLRISEVVELVNDAKAPFVSAIREQDPAKKKEIIEKLKAESLPTNFRLLTKLLTENSTEGIFVGRELTLADLVVYDTMFMVKSLFGYDACAEFPPLAALYKKVEANPRIKAYLAKRKETAM